VVTGLRAQGARTFHSFRHTCGSELLEAGVTHPHAAYWIGDTEREFMRTYGRPTDEAMAKAIFTIRRPQEDL
jgi:integrase